MDSSQNQLPRLKPKHQAFVDLYVGDAKFDAIQAAKMAGYKGSREAARLLVKKLSQHIDAKLDTLRSQAKMSPEEVMENLTTMARDTKSPSTRIRALELLAKINGQLNDKVVISQDRKQLLTEIDAIVNQLAATRIVNLTSNQEPS